MKTSGPYTTMAWMVVGLGLWCPLYARQPKMVQVDRSYNGREVVLAVGDVVDISLAENPTTGFRWELAAKPGPACLLVKSTFEPAVGPPGKGGTHHWHFQAAHSGTAEVALEYRRPWERNTPPAKRFMLSLRVRKERTPQDSTARSE